MLRKVNTILFATNLSESSREAFNHAILLATQCNARIIVLHMVEKQSTFESRAVALFGEEKWQDMTQAHLKAAEQTLIGKITQQGTIRAALQEFCREAQIANGECGYVDKQIVIQEGDIVEGIMEKAKAHNCELIVMGASKGLMAGTAIGPHIKSVLKRAHVPVLVIPPPRRSAIREPRFTPPWHGTGVSTIGGQGSKE